VLARLGEIRDHGLHVGLTLSGPRQRETIERALDIRVDGRPLWSAVQATWNLCARSVEPALRAAKAAGLRVLIKEAIAKRPPERAIGAGLLREEAARLHDGPDAVWSRKSIGLKCAKSQGFYSKAVRLGLSDREAVGPLQFLIVLVASWLARQQGEAIEYLRAENRVLRGRLGPTRPLHGRGAASPR
jgi:hypothetical protein